MQKGVWKREWIHICRKYCRWNWWWRRYGSVVKNKIIEKNIHSEVTKIYINAGKKKKIRVIDIVGAFSNLPGINNEDIGVVEVQDLCSYVDILNYKGEELVKKYIHLSGSEGKSL